MGVLCNGDACMHGDDILRVFGNVRTNETLAPISSSTIGSTRNSKRALDLSKRYSSDQRLVRPILVITKPEMPLQQLTRDREWGMNGLPVPWRRGKIAHRAHTSPTGTSKVTSQFAVTAFVCRSHDSPSLSRYSHVSSSLF
jgi:hypothetical protein